MTKKDYIQFAKMLANELNKCYDENQRNIVRSVCASTATIFKIDNENFDVSKFFNAISKNTDIR